MSKKIAMTARPQAVSPQADKWVSDQAAAEREGSTKRLTIDVPEDNHTRFKALCAMQKKKMAEEINAFIAQRIAEAEERGRAS
jgi:ParG